MVDISKITVNSNTYDLKDATARNQIASMSGSGDKTYWVYRYGYEDRIGSTNWSDTFALYLKIQEVERGSFYMTFPDKDNYAAYTAETVFKKILIFTSH